jgi:hypothetical protein
LFEGKPHLLKLKRVAAIAEIDDLDIVSRLGIAVRFGESEVALASNQHRTLPQRSDRKGFGAKSMPTTATSARVERNRCSNRLRRAHTGPSAPGSAAPHRDSVVNTNSLLRVPLREDFLGGAVHISREQEASYRASFAWCAPSIDDTLGRCPVQLENISDCGEGSSLLPVPSTARQHPGELIT